MNKSIGHLILQFYKGVKINVWKYYVFFICTYFNVLSVDRMMEMYLKGSSFDKTVSFSSISVMLGRSVGSCEDVIFSKFIIEGHRFVLYETVCDNCSAIRQLQCSDNVTLSWDFLAFVVVSWIELTWAPDKQANLILLKDLFLRRYSRNNVSDSLLLILHVIKQFFFERKNCYQSKID